VLQWADDATARPAPISAMPVPAPVTAQLARTAAETREIARTINAIPTAMATDPPRVARGAQRTPGHLRDRGRCAEGEDAEAGGQVVVGEQDLVGEGAREVHPGDRERRRGGARHVGENVAAVLDAGGHPPRPH